MCANKQHRAQNQHYEKIYYYSNPGVSKRITPKTQKSTNYLSYIGICAIGDCQYVIKCCYHDIGYSQHPTNISSVLCPTISVNISLYQYIWCFTHNITRASRCLPNCARFVRCGPFFRYYTRAGYLTLGEYIL